MAVALAGLLPGASAVAVAWRDQASGVGEAGFDPAAASLRPRLVDALGVRANEESAVHRWFSTGGEVAFAVVWDSQVVPDASWLDAARVVTEAAHERACLQAQVSELEKSKRLRQALYEIADLSGQYLELPRMLQRIHEVVASLMYAENFFIVEYDPIDESMRFVYFVDTQHGFAPDPGHAYTHEDFRGSLTFALLERGTPLWGPSDHLALGLGMPHDPSRGPDSKDWLGVPMLRDGRVAGAIVVQSYDERIIFNAQDRSLLIFVAQHVQTALERRQAQVRLAAMVAERTAELRQANRSLQKEIVERRRAETLQMALFRISELAVASESQEQFYAEVHSVVGGLLDARNFYIATLDDSGEYLEFPYSVDEHHRVRPRRSFSNGLTEYVIATRCALLADRAQIDVLAQAGELTRLGREASSWLGVPLFIEDEVVGAVVVQSYSDDVRYSLDDQRLLAFAAHNIGNGLARQRGQARLRQAHAELEQRVDERTSELAQLNEQLVGQIAERIRAEQRLTHQALHDALTGLPNRAHLLDRLDRAISLALAGTAPPFAVLFLDLDRFKLVNDSVGHAAGDRMLVEVAQRIVATVRAEDVIARLGGDEFAILMHCPEGLEEASNLARRLHGVLGQPMWVAGRELFPSGSVGVAFWNARYRSGEELLRDADAAMYRAKAQAHERFAVFDEAMREEAMRSLDLEADIRRALKRRDFQPYYQPIVRLDDGCVVGYEALLRWNHESRGLLRPDAFIHLGENSGLIEYVDWQLYEQVIGHLARTPAGYISVNVSPLHFRSSGFIERLLGLVDAAGADPARLRLEITEVALLEDAPRILDILNRLRARGVMVLLDDFGTGYSALSYLYRFPISVLKIDRSFVVNLHAQDGQDSLALVRSILALAASLGIETVGEGIETQRQLQTLREFGCHYGQGYLLGVPVPEIPGSGCQAV
ncbi:MAG: EAL domain-containing protein [Pseudomonas sp.]